MVSVSFTHSGDLNRTTAFLESMQRLDILRTISRYGQEGVNALASATPVDTGLAASSWSYGVQQTRGGFSIAWSNYDIENGFPVVIMLQYGYGTGTGGFVQGRDFINPAIRPIFDRIANDVWKVVTSS